MTGRGRVAWRSALRSTWRSHSSALVLATASAAGCIRAGPAAAATPTRDWIVAVVRAQAAAAAGRYAEADSVLAAFTGYPGAAPLRSEAAYWRAVFQLDPANPNGNHGRALGYLAQVLTDTVTSYHVAEARALRGLALDIDSLDRATTTLRARIDSLRSAPPPAPRTSPREDELAREVQRLKDQLEKTTAALDLIRRRLTAPGRPAPSRAGGGSRPGGPPTRP